MTIGRSVEADITLNDEHAAPLHASLEITRDGKLLLSDLGSRNGVIIGGQRLHGIQKQDISGKSLLIGHTSITIRTSHDTLPDEKSDILLPGLMLRDPKWLAGIGATAVASQLAFDTWLSAPRDLTTSLVGIFAAALAVCGIWVAIWALLSRVMRGEWRWLRHAAIGLGVWAIISAFSSGLDLIWYMFSLPPPGSRDVWLGILALGSAIWLHMVHASTLTMRRAAQIACAVTVLIGGATYFLSSRASMLNVNTIDARLQLYTPGLRLVAATDLQDHINRLALIQTQADDKLRDMLADDPDSEDYVSD